jgi:hypothetical protein
LSIHTSKFDLVINGVSYTVSSETISGAQVRALAAVDPTHTLVIEGEGSAADQIVGDDQFLKLGNRHLRFFTSPPAMFG